MTSKNEFNGISDLAKYNTIRYRSDLELLHTALVQNERLQDILDTFTKIGGNSAGLTTKQVSFDVNYPTAEDTMPEPTDKYAAPELKVGVICKVRGQSNSTLDLTLDIDGRYTIVMGGDTDNAVETRSTTRVVNTIQDWINDLSGKYKVDMTALMQRAQSSVEVKKAEMAGTGLLPK